MKWNFSIKQLQQAFQNGSILLGYLSSAPIPVQGTQQQFFQEYIRLFFMRPGPVTSPEGYIWDPQRRRWIPNHSGEGWLGLALGIIFTLLALKLIGG